MNKQDIYFSTYKTFERLLMNNQSRTVIQIYMFFLLKFSSVNFVINILFIFHEVNESENNKKN